ncbi:long-chain acyl-CoA synthetase [Marinicella pacifica]|uniref:Long-chain acyl-CoA synthetase n=1 Tax=Marinicella pacifica TaxID=1171543 RepID=A0A917FHU7_9GAMM|nr:AMP-binding protein [Marinicella pacifica]GGF84216.1 long-chain acyl-CoA synthetase [Marinicella pacifica]
MLRINQGIDFNPQCVAIHSDNNPEWLTVDQWATAKQCVIVPVPHFFTATQIAGMVDQAGVDSVFCQAEALPLWLSLGFQQVAVFGALTVLARTPPIEVNLPKNTHKITFTSGSTAQPKGVRLSLSHLLTVGQSLARATEHLGLKKHLSALPYSILLENMAAVYANQFANKGQGLDIVSVPMAEVGLQGSGHFQPEKLVEALIKHQADSLIMMPAMLKALLQYLSNHPNNLSSVKFMAVGGAVCPPALIRQAHEMGLPVFQGYGISECGSVICLNKELSEDGSVGRPLSHARLSLDDNSQIIYRGPRFLGYLGDTTQDPDDKYEQSCYATGDTGVIDQQGRLTILGRLTHLIVNGFGRNISPEWIEAELLALAAIQQVMVVGDGQAFLTALCVSEYDEETLFQLIQPINSQLPDYARIQAVICVAPFNEANGTLTATGKLIRQEIYQQHLPQLEQIYDKYTSASQYGNSLLTAMPSNGR